MRKLMSSALLRSQFAGAAAWRAAIVLRTALRVA